MQLKRHRSDTIRRGYVFAPLQMKVLICVEDHCDTDILYKFLGDQFYLHGNLSSMIRFFASLMFARVFMSDCDQSDQRKT